MPPINWLDEMYIENKGKKLVRIHLNWNALGGHKVFESKMEF